MFPSFNKRKSNYVAWWKMYLKGKLILNTCTQTVTHTHLIQKPSVCASVPQRLRGLLIAYIFANTVWEMENILIFKCTLVIKMLQSQTFWVLTKKWDNFWLSEEGFVCCRTTVHLHIAHEHRALMHIMFLPTWNLPSKGMWNLSSNTLLCLSWCPPITTLFDIMSWEDLI